MKIIRVYNREGKIVCVFLSPQDPVFVVADMYFRVVIEKGKYFMFDARYYTFASDEWGADTL